MIIQPTNPKNEPLKLATCAAKLSRPLEEYDQQSVTELIERGESPVIRGPRSIHQPVNAFKSLKSEMMSDNEWRFVKSLNTIVVDDENSKPVIYALIPPSIVASMSDVDFHSLLESLANNERLKDHIRKQSGYDCGLVFFMIDNTKEDKSEPMGLDYQRFRAEPNKDKLVMLGATGSNPITPPDIQEFAQTDCANRHCLVGTDLRRIVPESTKAAKYIVTETPPLLACFSSQRDELRMRLNGRAIKDDQPDPKQELKELIESGDVDPPRNGERLSKILLDRTAPSVVDQAKHYEYNQKAKTFIDGRDSDNYEPNTDYNRQFYKEQLGLRSPYPVRGQSAVDKVTI